MKLHTRWITHYEKSGCLRSPRYAETLAYFKQFEKYTPYAKMFSIGRSPQGRSIECIVISKDKEFTPAKAQKSGKAVIVIQNGIHSGEIEGKDACMILLREILITKEKFHLLDNLILVIIPVLNVDGHERISRFNRPNQNGPLEMGWRTTSWNLNLNRDYMKGDTPEIAAVLTLFNSWCPDFFIDNHTTNGADYQYHLTYTLEKFANIDRSLAKWGKDHFLPAILKKVEAKGFLTGLYVLLKKDELIEGGIINTPSEPRLSTGYAALQNRHGLLVETHSLKPFENRVRSTLEMNYAALQYLNDHFRQLLKLNRRADSVTKNLRSLPINFELSGSSKPLQFKGFETVYKKSPITGNEVVYYSDRPIEFTIPLFDDVKVVTAVRLPKAYFIPKEFDEIVRRMELHGIKVERLAKEKSITVTELSFNEYTFSLKPYEGRQCVKVKCKSRKVRVNFPEGTYHVRLNQRVNRVIVNLLEPEAPDSFVSWGFFNAFFERKEYAEAYVMEPFAQQMMANDVQLKKQFNALMEEQTFRNDPHARLEFFYQRSPFFDQKEMKYPIYRLE